VGVAGPWAARGSDALAVEAHQTGLEPATFRLGGGPSSQLRYWCSPALD
jgi:hypothetical protein